MAALQAFIIFDNERNSCPMESLLGNPLALEDETQIISIQSSYENYHNRKYSCNWKFSAPFGYGFKIVIESFHTTSKFIVENTTEAFLK
uniref:CUB domain-containing protein n=1 Tax=Panagrolaimus davidi TaxID=227884 RepID=A0A914Q6L6_9BILA